MIIHAPSLHTHICTFIKYRRGDHLFLSDICGMFDMITDIMESLANLKTIIGLGGGGLAVLSTLGAVPKVGAGRALTLHLKSILTSASPFSIRSKEINFLRSKLKALRKGHYLVVTGGKGLGKTCLINSVLHRYGGVVTISVRFFKTCF